MRRRFAAGFSLVELLIGISIAALLLTLALPGYQEFMTNTQIRNAAESISTGMRTAQAYAIKHNTNCNNGSPDTCVEFILDPANGWDVVDRANPVPPVASERWVAGAGRATVAVLDPVGATMVSFNSLGRIVDPNPRDASAGMQRIQVTSTATANARDLRVLVNWAGYMNRVCDFNLPATDTKGCP